MFQEIKASLQQLYLEDERPWLVGFSGGKDSTMLASHIIGRGYPPPNRTFRWCTQRMKIDPVSALVKQRVGIRCSGDLRSPTGGRRPPLQTGARRAESSTRAQTMAARPTRNGLQRHPDLPRVWVSNPIEFLSTEDVWAYLLQNPNPWGGDNRPLYKLYGCCRAEWHSAQAERRSALHASAGKWKSVSPNSPRLLKGIGD